MTNMKINRYVVSGQRPTSGKFGELYWNEAENAFGVVTVNGVPYDIINEGITQNGQIVAVSTTNDLASIVDPAPVVMVGSYRDGYNYGGGMFTYEAGSTKEVDGILVFDATNATSGGRYTRYPPGGAIPASWAGLYRSAADDQSVTFQYYIKYCIQNKFAALIDVDDINMGGNVIWFNYEGAFAAYTQSTLKMYTDRPRAKCRLYNGYFFFGHQYVNIAADGAPPELRWAPNTNASVRYTVNDIEFRGHVFLWNIEGAPVFNDLSVVAEVNNPDFYKNPPVEYGVNMLGEPWLDDESNTSSIQYENIQELFLAVDTNHLQVLGCSVQNGINVENSAGDPLDALWIAGSSNPTVDGGILFTCRDTLIVGSHPIFAGAGNAEVKILNVHIEDFYRCGIKITHCQGMTIDGGVGRPNAGWDGTEVGGEAAVIIGPSANQPERVKYNYSMLGYDVGTCVSITSGIDIKLDGNTRNFDVGVAVTKCDGLRDIGTFFEDIVTDEVQILDPENVWSLVDNTGPASTSSLAQLRSTKSITEDFTGYFLSDKWREYKGTGVTVGNRPNGREYRIDGDVAPNDMTGGAKLSSSPLFRPIDGKFVFEAAITTETNGNVFRWWIGLMDSPAAEYFPCNINGDNDLVDLNGFNWAGFIYTEDAGTNVVYCVSRKNVGPGQITATAYTFGSREPKWAYRIEIEENGTARFLIDGVTVAVHTAAVGTSDALAAAVHCYTVATSEREFYVSRIGVEQTLNYQPAFAVSPPLPV